MIGRIYPNIRISKKNQQAVFLGMGILGCCFYAAQVEFEFNGIDHLDI